MTHAANTHPAPRDTLDLYIDGIKHLPPMPALMVKLLALFKKTNVDVDEVVGLISRDPSLTAEVLKRCNSAYFGAENPVSDMFEAVSRLGFYEVYRVVVMLSGAHTMALQTSAAGLCVETLWKHSLATAVAAGIIAKEVEISEVNAFTAGLLHDVGKIVLASADGAKYGGMFAPHSLTTMSSLVHAEKEAFGFDHGEVGGRLLDRWFLPTDVAQAITYHHNLAGAGWYARLAATVSLADVLAHVINGKSAGSSKGSGNGAEAIAILKLSPAAVTFIMAKVKHGLERDAKLLGAAA